MNVAALLLDAQARIVWTSSPQYAGLVGRAPWELTTADQREDSLNRVLRCLFLKQDTQATLTVPLPTGIVTHEARFHALPAAELAALAFVRPIPPAIGALSERERQVLQCVAAGMATKLIGKRLHISYSTVETHIYRAKAKLGIQHLPALVAFAVENRDLL